MIRLAVLASVALLLAAPPAGATVRDHGGGDVRVTSACGGGASAELRLKTEDDGIEVRFELRQRRANAAWRVTFVHERRVVLKTTVRTVGLNRSFRVRRTLPDLPGSDTVTAHAWGPRGLTCRATATIPA